LKQSFSSLTLDGGRVSKARKDPLMVVERLMKAENKKQQVIENARKKKQEEEDRKLEEFKKIQKRKVSNPNAKLCFSRLLVDADERQRK
jgi:hypothetical protein